MGSGTVAVGSVGEAAESFSVSFDGDLTIAAVESIVRDVCLDDLSEAMRLFLTFSGPSLEPSISRSGGFEAKSAVDVTCAIM